MSNTVLIGAQWGDEGKGKIIDVLAEETDIVVRYQGGNNAGHTIKLGEEKYVLHLIPSGVLHPGRLCVIGHGLVVDPLALVTELTELENRGIQMDGRLFVSDRAHVVFPYHRRLDACREGRSRAGSKIGTTQRGIGPTYGDKVMRHGLRMGDLLDPMFGALAESRVQEANILLSAMGGEPLEAQTVVADYQRAAQRLAPYITDTITLLNKAVDEGKSILFEGAQGTMLDIDFGTYPFVTSSNSTAGGACIGTGIAPQRIGRVIGVMKAYTTRVGEGPFPTELTDAVGEHLRKAGGEFGATTGRPRRCGWFDAVVTRYATLVNGIDFAAMTKLDVLDEVETLKICTAYECDGQRYDTIPANIRVYQKCVPVYEEMPGWMSQTSSVTRYDDLPVRAKDYVKRLCELTGVKLGILSVGPRRDSTLRIAI